MSRRSLTVLAGGLSAAAAATALCVAPATAATSAAGPEPSRGCVTMAPSTVGVPSMTD